MLLLLTALASPGRRDHVVSSFVPDNAGTLHLLLDPCLNSDDAGLRSLHRMFVARVMALWPVPKKDSKTSVDAFWKICRCFK